MTASRLVHSLLVLGFISTTIEISPSFNHTGTTLLQTSAANATELHVLRKKQQREARRYTHYRLSRAYDLYCDGPYVGGGYNGGTYYGGPWIDLRCFRR